MAGYNPYATNSYQGTQMFPQPQGNVYTLNNSMEIANIPVSGGISVGICPSENLMYIKAMVNGAPSLMVYTITPCETKQNLQNDEVSSRLERLEGQIEEIKKLFETEASKEKTVDKETVSECMWHETHEMFQHWYDDIERKIKKYS